MSSATSEKLVSRIWQHQLIASLITDAGAKLQIVHPGRPHNGSGCDFKDAVFTIDGQRITGNIEIHVKSSHWYSHGHHSDPKYNDVALHITMWQDSPSPAKLENGKIIPTVCLSHALSDNYIKLSELQNHPPPLCPHADYSNSETLRNSLTIAGEKRFATKIDAFKRELGQEKAGQVLFRGITRAVGYSQNTEPCEELSSRLRLSLLEEVKPDTLAARQALLLGTAGLLPLQRLVVQSNAIRENEAKELDELWKTNGITQKMKEGDWCFYRVRPDNFPTRRLIALSYILTRYRKSGLLHGMVNLVSKAPQGAERRWLEDGISVAGQGYWANHLDFGMPKRRSSALLGQERATNIIINVVLPFAYAWGEAAAKLKLKVKTAEIYSRYPGLGDNELTRYMKQQLRIRQGCNLSACQQQGLIHIFKNNCRTRNCPTCPVALIRN